MHLRSRVELDGYQIDKTNVFLKLLQRDWMIVAQDVRQYIGA